MILSCINPRLTFDIPAVLFQLGKPMHVCLLKQWIFVEMFAASRKNFRRKIWQWLCQVRLTGLPNYLTIINGMKFPGEFFMHLSIFCICIFLLALMDVQDLVSCLASLPFLTLKIWQVRSSENLHLDVVLMDHVHVQFFRYFSFYLVASLFCCWFCLKQLVLIVCTHISLIIRDLIVCHFAWPGPVSSLKPGQIRDRDN